MTPGVSEDRVQVLQGDWLLAPDADNRGREQGWHGAPHESARPTRVPGTIQETFPGYHGVAWYWHRFSCRFAPATDERVRLRFCMVEYYAQVWLNGEHVGSHEGCEGAFELDVTAGLRPGDDNLLTVRVLDPTDVPIDGFVHAQVPHSMREGTFSWGGIYTPVQLCVVPSAHIADVFARPCAETGEIALSVTLRNDSGRPALGTLRATAGSQGQGETEAETSIAVRMPKGASVHELSLTIAAPRLWDVADPHLYRVNVSLDTTRGEASHHEHAITCGFRDFRVKDGYFHLNGRRIFLRCAHYGKYYPVGQTVPLDPDHMRRDLYMAKACGFNTVRFLANAAFPEQLDYCDQIGLMVYEECSAAWGLGDMIERDRNHPAIIIWGVRINESPDDDPFFARTNALARALDPTRPTGGVRNFLESQFLEDVFTYNDFSNTVVEPRHKPHLVTEFNGHMFPTKLWDHTERQVEHALRHARIHDRQLGMEHVAGAIGWCAFDYNTHYQFGSGDRICYHGVMDIFRLPKFAAYTYASQMDPARRVVLFAASFWAVGDYDASRIERLIVFSNCDSIEVFVGQAPIGRFAPDRAAFPHLAHPPYQVPLAVNNLTWGQQFPDLRVIGYVGDRAVAEHCLDARGLPDRLVLQADFAELRADGADMTRVAFRIVDRCGNRLPYTNQPVFLTLDGPADLIGENPFAVMGGQGAVYVRARHEPGRVTVQAVTPRLAPQTVTITLA